MVIQALQANTALLKTVKTGSESVVAQEKTNIWSVEQEKEQVKAQSVTSDIEEENLTFGEKLKKLWDKPAVKIAVATLSTVVVSLLAAKGIKAAKAYAKPQTFGDAMKSFMKKKGLKCVDEATPGFRKFITNDNRIATLSYDVNKIYDDRIYNSGCIGSKLRLNIAGEEVLNHTRVSKHLNNHVITEIYDHNFSNGNIKNYRRLVAKK